MVPQLSSRRLPGRNERPLAGSGAARPIQTEGNNDRSLWVLPGVRIEIWSDIACPWCAIGKRRFEKALAAFPHRDQVEVVHRSYLLDPGAPTQPVETVAEVLGRKYGGGAAAGRAMVDRVEAAAAEEGMVWRHHESLRVSTLDAHRLLHLSRETGHEPALLELLYAAYFAEGRNVADHDTLLALATEVGMPEQRVREVLGSTEFTDEVFAEAQEAGALGATGVPFFVIERRYAVPGAQPAEVFSQVLAQAWADTHPGLQVVGAGDDACGPEGCAI